MLTGEEPLDEGERVVRGGLSIGYLDQAPSFAPDDTIRDVVRAGLADRERLVRELDEVHEALAASDLSEDDMERLLRRSERLQAKLELEGGHDVEHWIEATIDGGGLRDPEAACGTLSGGEVRRTALARLLVSGPDLLLLDEPTNHLDAFVIAWLEERLARLRVPLVLVTHDRYLLDRTVDRIVEVDRGKLYEYDGGYSRYLEERAARLATEERLERSRLALVRRETVWIKRQPLARTSKSKSRIARYQELVAAARDRPADELELAFPPGQRLGQKVVRLTGIAHSYGDRQVLAPLDLELTGDMRLGIVGPNGAGKSTLLGILLGTLTPSAGEIDVGETVRFATIDQSRSDLDPEKTVVEEVAGDGDHVAVGSRMVHVAGFLDRFLFPGPRKNVAIKSLSGGERARVLLAKLMLTGGNVVVLDEPTNDLDLSTLRALEEALQSFAGVVVVVSHDRWFLDRVATHVLHVDETGRTELHTGEASELLARLQAERAAARSEARDASKRPAAPKTETAEPAAAAGDSVRAPARLSNWERAELDELTGRIDELETRARELDERLADPELYRGGGEEVRELREAREAASAELEAAMSRWEELAERDGA